ncbi:hypothetical protein NT6N_40500 [Oceaniferula spumae]|uniref:Uncharacterized protein n=2 Tax=Oceaniferula spumae TaxID=2979115 RepID=A0AAT9FSM3_9BACT
MRMSENEHNQDERDLGPQPLDRMMVEWGMDNHDMVEVSTEQLTHKQVQKARKGRRLTLKMMQKVTRAFNVCIWHRLNAEQKEAYYEYMHRDLFNYAKGHNANWEDPNKGIQEALAEK